MNSMYKKIGLLLMLATTTQSTLPGTARGMLDKLKTALPSMKEVGTYVFSGKGLADAAVAYGLCMGITASHYLGQAIAGKVLSGDSIEVSLGSSDMRRKPYIKKWGVGLAGFNPLRGSSWGDISYGMRPLNDAAMIIAGPVCGAASSL